MVSNVQTVNESKLSPAELSLVEAYRKGDWTHIGQLLASHAGTVDSAPESPDQTTQTDEIPTYRPGFSSVRKIAAAVFAKLILTDSITPDNVDCDSGNGASWVMGYIEAAITQALPLVDDIEIARICKGVK